MMGYTIRSRQGDDDANSMGVGAGLSCHPIERVRWGIRIIGSDIEKTSEPIADQAGPQCDSESSIETLNRSAADTAIDSLESAVRAIEIKCTGDLTEFAFQLAHAPRWGSDYDLPTLSDYAALKMG